MPAVEKQLAEAKKKEAGAADDAARVELTKEVKALEGEVAKAKQAVTDAEAKLKQYGDARAAAEKHAKALADKAKEKTSQFAAYSQQITVQVLPKPDPKAK